MDNTTTKTDTINQTTRAMRGPSGDTSGNTNGNTDGGTPPAMLGNGEMMKMCDPTADADCEMPELPDGEEFNGEMMPGGGFRGMGDMGKDFIPMEAEASHTWHPAAYLALGGCSVILGLVISYACFSRCFHLKPGQTFSTLAKFIWFIVAALVIAAGLMVLCYFIPEWTAA